MPSGVSTPTGWQTDGGLGMEAGDVDNIGKVIVAWLIYSGALPPCPHLGIANVRKKAPTGTPKWL